MRSNVKNALIFSGIAAGVLALLLTGTSKLLKFKRLVSFNISGIKKFDIVGIDLLKFPPDLGSLRFIFDIAVDNAVNEEYSLTVPYIRAYIDGVQIGNSIPKPDRIIIKPSQRTMISNNDLRIPTINLKSLGLNKDSIQSMIANRSFRLNRTVKFIVGLTVNSIETSIEIPVNL